VEIKTGDNTRSLIGMVKTNGSSQFADDIKNRLVASWFNRRPRAIYGATAGSVTTTSATPAIATGTLSLFLSWADGALFSANGFVSNNTASANNAMQVGMDNNATSGILTAVLLTNADDRSGLASSLGIEPGEGAHDIGAYIAVNAGTGTFTVNAGGTVVI
jgi:hypothetical protein